ncbi:helix-turn-helix transcriptional regulator [Roseibium salinum]|nr:helix-turn-helix transcriptional regulator [Roseibium salinum]
MRIPMRRFIIRVRLIRARALLFEGNLSIANVAFQSGFSSQSQFYTHFRSAYGMTPLEMRQKLLASGKLIPKKTERDSWTDCQRDAV